MGTHALRAGAVLLVLVSAVALAIPVLSSFEKITVGGFVMLVLSIACFIFGMQVARGVLVVPRSPLLFVAIPLLIISAVSFLFSRNLHEAFWGTGLEIGTLGSVMLLIGVFMLGALLSREHIGQTFRLFPFFAAVVALVFLVRHLAFSTPLSPVWPETSFFFTAALLVSLLYTCRPFDNTWALYGVCAALTLGASVLVFHIPTVLALAFILLMIAGVRLQQSFGAAKNLSGLFIALCIFAALFIFGVRHPLIESPPDGRPSFAASTFVLTWQYADGPREALLGNGPNSFAYAWDKYRSFEFNAGPQWDIVPEYGYSTVLTFSVLFGILGVLAFLLVPVSVLIAFAARWVRSGIDSEAEVVFSVALLSFLLHLWYPAQGISLYLGFFAAGASTRLLTSETDVHLSKIVRIPVVLAAALVGCWLLSSTLQQFSASTYYERGATLFNGGQGQEAEAYLEKAANIWKSALYFRDTARVKAENILAAAERGEEAAGLKRAMGDALEYADKAAYRDLTVRSSLQRTSLHISAYQLYNIDNALQVASSSVNTAYNLAPSRPDVQYFMAVVSLLEGDSRRAETLVREALRLKPDYKEAIQLSQQLQGRQ